MSRQARDVELYPECFSINQLQNARDKSGGNKNVIITPESRNDVEWRKRRVPVSPF